MGFLSFWRAASDQPEWGKSPALQPGELVRLQSGGDGTLGMYQARVRAVGMRRILMDTDEASAIPRGPLTLFYARGDALYHFVTRPIGPARRGALTVVFPRQVVRLQRRQFYRMPLESPTVFRVLSPDGRLNSEPVPARLINVSGGGALLSSPRPLPSGVEVSVRIPSGKAGEAIPIDAEVLDSHVATQGPSRVYLLRLRFFGSPRLTDEDREEVIAFIHEQQRIMLRTRKLLRA